MRLIWHIVKKDFRRCRWMLLLLAAIWLVKTVLLYETLHRYDRFSWNEVSIALNGVRLIDLAISRYANYPLDTVALLARLSSFTDIFLLLGVILCVMKEDSPIEERPFWRTRPIHFEQMFAAKALFIAMVAWPVPVALQMVANIWVFGPFSHWYYFDWLSHLIFDALSHGFRGVPDVILIQAGWAAVAIVAAALWKNWVVGLGVMALAFLLMLSTSMSLELNWDHPHFSFVVPVGLAGSAAIAFVMYRGSNRKLAFSMFASLTALIFTLLSIP